LKTKSCKAKARKLQDFTRDSFRELGSHYGLQDDDIKSTIMGVPGQDVLFSPAARQVFPKLAVETKNRESLNITTEFWKHSDKYPGFIPILVSKRNKAEPIVTLRFSDFMDLLAKGLNGKSI
jgi:hypothetical protein